MNESTPTLIEAIFTGLSVVLSVLALSHSNIRDKKKQSVKMIDDFDTSILSAVDRTSMASSISEKSDKAYKAMKLVIKFYVRIESKLINERLTRRYLASDIKQITKILTPIANTVFKSSRYPELRKTAERYSLTLKKLKKRKWL